MEQNLTGRTNGEHCQENLGGIKKDKRLESGTGIAQPSTACITELGKGRFIYQMTLSLEVSYWVAGGN